MYYKNLGCEKGGSCRILLSINIQKSMKNISKIIRTLACTSLIAATGCAHQQVKTARGLEIVDTIPDQSGKGYVEFTSLSKEAVVPIYLLDEQRRPHLLAGTGIRQGDHYSFRTYQTLVGEKVRVAVPPGTHSFMIEGNG